MRLLQYQINFLSKKNLNLLQIEMESEKSEIIKIPFSVKGGRKGNPKPKLLRNGESVDLEKMKDLIEIIVNDGIVEIKFKVCFSLIFKI